MSRVPGRNTDQPVRALVVDSDAVSRRFAEHVLAGAGFTVESANDGASAVEILHAQLVDLIVCEMELTDLNGLALVRRLRQESRLRELPFVFLASDRRPETRIAALRAGVDDYLVKPCNAGELAARCEALVLRRQRLRATAGERRYSLAGDFTSISFPDLVSLLELGRRMGVLSVVGTRTAGEVFFCDGKVVHATCGNLEGPEAFYGLFELTSSHFEFTPGAKAPAQTITATAMSLLMEAARRFDTAERDACAGPARATSPVAALPPRVPGPPPPDARLARQIERALGDGFTLGELQLFDNESLERWSSWEIGRERLQIHLIADQAAGVSALLPLGGSPNEKWVLDALQPEAKSFGVSFYLRNERTVDVLLLDAAHLGAVLPSLRRVPALCIVAPPCGELLGLGTRGRALLDKYLRQVSPPAVLGLGNATLEESLTALVADARPGALVGIEQGELLRADVPLRDLLVRGLQLWARLAAPEDREASG
jgi:CheY-like chemotaxis protein